MRETFGACVEKGVVVFDSPVRWRAVLARHEGRRIEVEIGREYNVRSLKQNAYYWRVVVPFYGEWAGEEKEEAHETLKTLHLMVEHILPSGELVRKPGSTRRLSTVDFNAYVERVCTWLAQQGVYVPPPGEKVTASL
jgi:hypothetical protein